MKRLPAWLLAAGAAGLAQIVFLVAVARQGWLRHDDFLNMAMVREMGLTPALLWRAVFGHFTPGHRLLNGIVIEGFGLSWVAACAVMGLAAVATSVILTLLVRELWHAPGGRASEHTLPGVLALVLVCTGLSPCWHPAWRGSLRVRCCCRPLP